MYVASGCRFDFESLKVRVHLVARRGCHRTNCKYFHPPTHLSLLVINAGKNNKRLRSEMKAKRQQQLNAEQCHQQQVSLQLALLRNQQQQQQALAQLRGWPPQSLHQSLPAWPVTTSTAYGTKATTYQFQSCKRKFVFLVKLIKRRVMRINRSQNHLELNPRQWPKPPPESAGVTNPTNQH